jgi:hypothetical protein
MAVADKTRRRRGGPPSMFKRTPWRASVYERWYRGVFVWVDETYATSPTWEWYAGTGEATGRARTAAAARKAAEAWVDDHYSERGR